MARVTVTAGAKQITCINKNDRHHPTERITHVGRGETLLSGWRMTLDEAIAFLDGGGSLYVNEGGKLVEVFAAGGPSGKRHLTTTPDDTTKNNLLSLPECVKW